MGIRRASPPSRSGYCPALAQQHIVTPQKSRMLFSNIRLLRWKFVFLKSRLPNLCPALIAELCAGLEFMLAVGTFRSGL